jgi:hypothetical protein
VSLTKKSALLPAALAAVASPVLAGAHLRQLLGAPLRMPRGRRLRIVSFRKPRSQSCSMDAHEDDEEDDDERRAAKGRAELSAAVLEVVQATRKPGLIRATRSAEPIRSKFWVQEDSDADVQPAPASPPLSPIPSAKEIDPTSPTTTEFIKEAMDAGFTIDQLARAEQRRLVGSPWEGPLPSPRFSPPRTLLGDCLASASRGITGHGGLSRLSARYSPSGSMGSSKIFETACCCCSACLKSAENEET